MEFSSLVLMEKDPVTNLFVRELDSFEVNEGAEYINKMYCISNVVTVYFDTMKDVEEWEYSAIFDLFDESAFVQNGFQIKEYEEEFNPTWIVNFDYNEDYEKNKGKINDLCSLIKNAMEDVFSTIQDKKGDYI